MLKGLNTSATGMLPPVKNQEIAANNIARAVAAGFKVIDQTSVAIDPN